VERHAHLQNLFITYGYNSWENVALVCTCSTTMFMLSNSLHFYKQFLQGVPHGPGLDKNELLLRRAQGPSDPTRLMTLSQITHMGHLS
jgi:hypothetical protein